MHDLKVLITWEAIYDITGIAEYIEELSGDERADLFQQEIYDEIEKLQYQASIFGKTSLLYRSYHIQKKLFRPSIIFYIIDEQDNSVHVLRVLREEMDWELRLSGNQKYTYPD